MTVRIVEFQPEHLERIKVQGAQTFELYRPANGPALVKAGPCFTALEEETVLACIGLIDMWKFGPCKRYLVWGLVSECGPKNFFRITQRVRNFLQAQEGPVRVEATIDHKFEKGHRWVQALGFRLETPDGMENYSAYGDRFDLYSWCKS